MALRSLFLALSICTSALLTAQNPAVYALFDREGKAVDFESMSQDLARAQVVLFGELHNDPIVHWLQYRLSAALLALEPELTLGAEMLEADNQKALNLYLSDSIDQKALDTLARLWPNYRRDYKAIIDLMKDSGRAVIATNIPRRYASQVYRQGLASLDSLSDSVKAWIAPLPIAYDGTLPGYQAMLEMMGGHGGENLPKAQAIKDATMAHFILAHYDRRGLFLHLNGDYHSKDFEGIVWYLKKEKRRLKIKTISTVLQDSTEALEAEYRGRADYILVVDQRLPRP